MFSKTRSSVLLLILFLSSCAPTIYKANTFNDSQTKVKKMAILPFGTTVDSRKLQKGSTIETLKESQEKTGYDVQGYVYSYFLQRQNNYSVEFQDVDKTNALLKKAGISYEDIALKDKEELCALLGVTGILSGKISMSKPMSDGAAVAVGFLTGGFGATNKADVALTIHDAQGKLQWKFDHKASGSLGSSAESIAKSLMKKVSKKFPYEK